MSNQFSKALRVLYLVALLSAFFQYLVAQNHAGNPESTSKAPEVRMDARSVVAGADTKELTPKQETLLRADLSKGQITPPEEGANPGLSEQQREHHRCRDSKQGLHLLGSTFLTFGTECHYYECEYNTDINSVAWMLSHDIYKCCFDEKYGYKEGAVMQGKCTKKVCMRDGEDNPYEGSMGWQVMETGCKRCTIGLVMLDVNETFHTGDPCLKFRCNEKAKLVPDANKTCCRLGDHYVADGQLAMTSVKKDCEVATCVNGHFTNRTKYKPHITTDDYVGGCPINWIQIQGKCYFSFTKPKRLEEAAHHCSVLGPARRSQLMRVDFGGMMGTMSDVMELGRWYWLVLHTQPKTPRYMLTNNETTPERFLVGHHAQPVVKKINHQHKLAFQPAEKKKHAYVCQMEHRPACKPVNYKEPKQEDESLLRHHEF